MTPNVGVNLRCLLLQITTIWTTKTGRFATLVLNVSVKASVPFIRLSAIRTIKSSSFISRISAAWFSLDRDQTTHAIPEPGIHGS